MAGSCPKGKHYVKGYKKADGSRVKAHCSAGRKSRRGSRKGSRKTSRRGSRKLSPQLRRMNMIVKRLSKETGLYGPALMKEAGKVYRREKMM